MNSKNHMRKCIAYMLIAVMLMVLCSCGQKEEASIQEITEAEAVEKSADVQEEAITEGEAAVEADSKTGDEAVKADNKAEEDGTSEDADAIQTKSAEDSSDDGEMIDEGKQTTEPETETASKKAPLSPEEIYAQVLDGYYADLVSEFPIDNYFPMTLGTFETTIGSAIDTALNKVGYAMKDINGDGMQELLIMEVFDRGQTSYHGDKILALYTIVNDEARFLAGGWARNRFYLLNDGMIYNEGSSGADDSSFEIYSLMESSTALEQIETMDSKSEDYFERCEELGKIIEIVPIKTFSEYETTENYPESAKEFWSAVYVDPAEKTYATTGRDSFTADTSDYAMDLVFFTPTEVSGFKFNALTPVSLGDEGVTFEEKELYSLDSLVMDKAVKITMAFAGDTPNYGISYTDAGGNERRYAICQSGFDGSIYLSPYEVAK